MDTAGLVMFGIGLLLVVFAPMGGVGFWRKRRRWSRAVAKVTRVRERKVPGKDVTDTWITYRFVDADGNSHGGSEPVLRRPKKGATLPVRYDPDNPGDSSPTSGDGLILALLLGVLPAGGLVLVVWGFVRLLG